MLLLEGVLTNVVIVAYFILRKVILTPITKDGIVHVKEKWHLRPQKRLRKTNPANMYIVVLFVHYTIVRVKDES